MMTETINFQDTSSPLLHFSFIFTEKIRVCHVLGLWIYISFFSFWKNQQQQLSSLTVWSSTYCCFSQEKYKAFHIYLPCINILIVNIVLWESSYQYSCLAHANLQQDEHGYEAANQGIKGQGLRLKGDSI